MNTVRLGIDYRSRWAQVSGQKLQPPMQCTAVLQSLCTCVGTHTTSSMTDDLVNGFVVLCFRRCACGCRVCRVHTPLSKANHAVSLARLWTRANPPAYVREPEPNARPRIAVLRLARLAAPGRGRRERVRAVSTWVCNHSDFSLLNTQKHDFRCQTVGCATGATDDGLGGRSSSGRGTSCPHSPRL